MRNVVIDIVGVSAICLGAASVAGCVEQSVRYTLQPLVAVAGAYGVRVGVDDRPKPPAPVPAGECSRGGSCKGTGKVLERPDKPDHKVYVTCPACGGAGDKTKLEAPCVTGTCRPATQRIVR